MWVIGFGTEQQSKAHGRWIAAKSMENDFVQMGVVAQMPVAADVGSGDERDELGSG